MSRGEAAVCEARRWLGTPYRHQASARGAGCDCLGLICGIWRGLYGRLPEAVPAYTPDWAEAGREERLWAAALRHMVPVGAQAAWCPGDILLFRMREGAVAKHLAILSQAGAGEGAQAPWFIHAYSGHGVVESPLSLPWRKRVVARFRFPETMIE